MKHTKSSQRTLRVPVSLIGQVFLAISVARARNDPPPSSERAWLSPGLFNYDNELAEAAPTPEDYNGYLPSTLQFAISHNECYETFLRSSRRSPKDLFHRSDTIFRDHRDRSCPR